MKKMLLSAALVLAAMSVNAQSIFTIDGDAFMTAQGSADPETAFTVQAGTVIDDNENFTLSIGATDDYKATGVAANDFSAIQFGTVVMDCSTNGITGSNNPKDDAGTAPTDGFNLPTTGAFFNLKAKKDGVVYVAHKASSNKAYAVFEGNMLVAYTFAMQVAEDPNVESTDGLISFTLPGDEYGYYDTSLGKIDQAIRIFHGNPDAASAGNGLGVIKFDVFAGYNYTFSAAGSKMSLKGICFSDQPVDVTLIGEDGVTKFPLLTSDPTGITEVVADKADNANAPAYNIAGQRVSKNAKGLVIINGKKYINK